MADIVPPPKAQSSPFADLRAHHVAFLASPGDDGFYIELFGGGATPPVEARPWKDLGDSLKYRGYHHVCFSVADVEATVAWLRTRGVPIALESVVVEAIRRKIAFFTDPFGNFVELAEVVG
jgi:glyoxylase I family protein